MKTSLRLLSFVSLSSFVCLGACTAPSGPATDTSESDLVISRPVITPVGSPVHAPIVTLCESNILACVPATAQLLIVGPESFQDEMTLLRNHKVATGMSTMVMTMEEIRQLHTGRDDAETLKKTIATMQAQHGTKYVMLAGDASVVPVRRRYVRSNPDDNNGRNEDYNISDNYYANLYRHGVFGLNLFSNWDADGDGHFNSEIWNEPTYSINPDQVDGLPDVAVGRVPAHTASDLAIYVNKVIGYENGNYGTYGLARAGFIAGGTYPGSDTELDQLADQSYLGSVDWRYSIDFPAAPDGYFETEDLGVIDGLMMTMGWVAYLGHGANNFWDISDPNGNYYTTDHVRTLQNQHNLPIVWAAACNTGKFAPSLPADQYLGVDGNMHQITFDTTAYQAWDNGVPIAYPAELPAPSTYDPPSFTDQSMGGAFLFPPNGNGAIMYFGDDVVTTDDQPRELEADVVNAYGAGSRVIGDMWLAGEQKFYSDHVGDETMFWNPRNYLGVMTMFGDPSLRLF